MKAAKNCWDCGEGIVFLRLKNGKHMPCNPDSVTEGDTEFDNQSGHIAHHTTCRGVQHAVPANWGVSIFACIVSAMLLCAGPAFAQGPVAVHNVVLNGTTYPVTEVLSTRRLRISKWNLLRLRRGQQYFAYKLLDNDMPLRLTVAQHKAFKKELRGVADHRSYCERHPSAQGVSDHYQRWGSVYNSAGGFIFNLATRR